MFLSQPLPLKLLFFKVTCDLSAAESNDHFSLIFFWLWIVFYKVITTVVLGIIFSLSFCDKPFSVSSWPHWALCLSSPFWLFLLIPTSKHWISSEWGLELAPLLYPTSCPRWVHLVPWNSIGSTCCSPMAYLQPSCLLTFIHPTNYLISLLDCFTGMSSIFIGIS